MTSTKTGVVRFWKFTGHRKMLRWRSMYMITFKISRSFYGKSIRNEKKSAETGIEEPLFTAFWMVFYNKLDSRFIENQSKKLVWKGDPRLKEFYRRRNPRLVRSSSRYSRSCQDTYNSGMTQGKNLVIHKGIQENGKGKVKFLN